MTEQHPEEIRYLCGIFAGDMPDGTEVGYGISAAVSTPVEILAEMSTMGVRGLEMQYPGVKDVRQVGDWSEQILYLDDEDETTEDA